MWRSCDTSVLSEDYSHMLFTCMSMMKYVHITFCSHHISFTCKPHLLHMHASRHMQVCLKGFYVGWIRRDSLDLEALVAELLTDTNIPPINCMPVKKPLGGLKELVLPPIHEATSLPYTSTSALWLLKSVGRYSQS